MGNLVKFWLTFLMGIFWREIWLLLIAPGLLIIYRYYVQAWEEIERVWKAEEVTLDPE